MLLDSAIVKALSLDLQVSHVSTHGHSGFTSSAKITTTIDDVLRQFFVKTGAEGDMFSSMLYGFVPLLVGNPLPL